MGYAHHRHTRLSGSDVIFERGTYALPSVTLYSSGHIALALTAGRNLWVKDGATGMLTLSYASNVTTVAGGGVTGDDFDFKANTIDSDHILMEGNGDILLAPTGVIKFGTFTGTGDAVSNGSIAIKDEAGNTRKLMTKA